MSVFRSFRNRSSNGNLSLLISTSSVLMLQVLPGQPQPSGAGGCSHLPSGPFKAMEVNFKNHRAEFSGCEAFWIVCFGPVHQYQFTVSCIVGLLRKAIALNSTGFAKSKRDAFGLALGLHGHAERCCLLSLTMPMGVC